VSIYNNTSLNHQFGILWSNILKRIVVFEQCQINNEKRQENVRCLTI